MVGAVCVLLLVSILGVGALFDRLFVHQHAVVAVVVLVFAVLVLVILVHMI